MSAVERKSNLLAFWLVATLGIVAAAVHPRTFFLPSLKTDVLLLSAAVLFLLVARTAVLTRRLQGPAALLGVWLVVYTLSTVLAEGHAFRLLRGLAVLLAYVLVALISREVFWRKGPWILSGYLSCALLLASIAVFQAGGKDLIYDHSENSFLGASPFLPVSTFGNTNACAAWLAPALAVSVALALGRGVHSHLALAALLPLVAALILARSRGSWIAALIAVGLVFWWGRGQLRRPRALGIVAVALGGVALGLLTPHRDSEVQRKTLGLGLERSSNVVRLSVLKGSTELLKESPWLGHGPDQFRVQYPRFREAEEAQTPTRFGATSEVDHPHNLPLRLACEGGLLSLFLAALVFLGVWRHLWTTGSAYRGDDGAGSRALLGGLTAFAVGGLFWSSLQSAEVGVVAAVFLGGALASRMEVEETSARRSFAALFLAGVCAVLLAGLSLPGLWGEAQTVRAIDHWQASEEQWQSLASAAERDPFSLDRQYSIAMVLADTLRVRPEQSEALLNAAALCAQRALQVHPQHVPSLELAAQISVQQGDSATALPRLRRLKQLEPWRPVPAQQLAKLERQWGRSAAAAATLADHLQEKDLEQTLTQVEELRKAGDSRQGAQLLHALVERYPAHANLQRVYALCLKDLGDEQGYCRHMGAAQLGFALESLQLHEYDVMERNLSLAQRFLGPDAEAVHLLRVLRTFRQQGEVAAQTVLRDLPPPVEKAYPALPRWLLLQCEELLSVPALAGPLRQRGFAEPR
jgi:O-antigen ligase